MAYAYVHYKEDGLREIVPIDHIKHFDLHNINAEKAYKVKFSKDNTYYRAFVLCTGETYEDTKSKSEERRFRIPTSRVEIESTTETQTESDEWEAKEQNSQNNKKSNREKKKLQEINNFSKILNSQPKDELKYEELKNEYDNLKIKFSGLKQENEGLRKELDSLKSLNVALQNDCIDGFKEFINYYKNERTIMNAPIIIDEEIGVGQRRNGNVHLGRGVFLPVQIFDSCDFHPPKKDALFIKDIAVAVFGEQTLLTSSVLGGINNRTSAAAKPALDSTKLGAINDIFRWRMEKRCESAEAINTACAAVHTIIGEKIQDIVKRHKPRHPRSKNNNSHN